MPKLIAAALATAAVGAAAAPALADTRVAIGDNWFVRPSGVPTVTVKKGTRVRWVWTGRSVHNVKVAKGPARFGSSAKVTGTFSKRLRRRGTYRIVCTIHGPRDQRMRLVVR